MKKGGSLDPRKVYSKGIVKEGFESHFHVYQLLRANTYRARQPKVGKHASSVTLRFSSEVGLEVRREWWLDGLGNGSLLSVNETSFRRNERRDESNSLFKLLLLRQEFVWSLQGTCLWSLLRPLHIRDVTDSCSPCSWHQEWVGKEIALGER